MAMAASSSEASDHVDGTIDDAEDCLKNGIVADATKLAKTVLQQIASATVQQKARAINVLIQADFHFENRLTDLNQLVHESGVQLHELPVTAVLLWGVVAVELGAADEARSLLRQYLDTKQFGEGSGVTREDALALSRLYAVQLLSGLCGDFPAAADWLTDGGAGLSEEQQELLLLEVDEAEELAQEEHVAVWTQDAAHAAQLGLNPHANGSAAAAENGGSDAAQDFGVPDAASAVGSNGSTAAAALQELGPSVSGVLSNSSLHPEQSPELETQSAVDHDQSSVADAAPSRTSQGSNGSGGHKQTPAAVAAEAGALLGAAVAALSSAEARLGSLSSPLPSPAALVPAAPAAVAVRGLGEAERVPSSPSLASWRRSPDEAAVQDQESQRSSSNNAFVTITGAFSDPGYDPEVVAALAAEAAAAAGAGSRPGGNLSGSASPQKSSRLGRLSVSSSELKSRLRDAASDVAAAAVAAVTTAVANGQAAVAAVAGAVEITAAEPEQKQHGEEGEEAAQQKQGKQQQQQQSWLHAYASWASDKANETWQSQPVQDALKAFNLQDVPAWELASGAAAAVLLTYGLYRHRRRVKRAAADFASGVSQTARMALGMSINPMAAVPGTGHMR